MEPERTHALLLRRGDTFRGPAAGTTYWLVATNNNKAFGGGRFADFTSFPVANADLSVDGAVLWTDGGNIAPARQDVWASFNNLTISELPEPGAATLLALGLVAFAARRTRRTGPEGPAS